MPTTGDPGARHERPTRAAPGASSPCRSSRSSCRSSSARSSSSSRSGSSPASCSRASPSTPTARCVRVGRLERGHRQHAHHHDAAAPRRAGGRPRLQGRPVQHRRPGPVPDGRARVGHRRRPAPGQPAHRRDPGVADRRHDLRGRVGLHPGLPEGVLGRPRGRHHDHAQLHRHRHPGCGRQRAARTSSAPRRRPPRRSATRRCRSSSAGTATIAHHLRADHGRPVRLPALPDDARVRDQDRRARTRTPRATRACRRAA